MNNNRIVLYITIGILILSFIFPFIMISFGIFFVIVLANPISETLTCTGLECRTAENFIIGTNYNDRISVKNKNQLEIIAVQDNLFHMNQYYIRIKNSHMQYVFNTSYLVRANAERDLRNIKENNNVTIVKRNVIFIQGLCIALYVILLIIGTIVRRIQQFRQNIITNRVEQLPLNTTDNDNR